ncbi:MAG: DUF4147 domain-containing protein [Pyrinomonadaceae bacterium]|nr:DUF4147 domain-containing protein [Pyrinomonadaceae bacterium]
MNRAGADLQSLRGATVEIFSAALKAVDAGAALKKKVKLAGARLKVFDSDYQLKDHPVYSIAIGKAARSMAAALDEILGSRLTEGILAAPSEAETKAALLLQQLVSVGQVSAEEAETEMFRGVVRKAIEQDERHPSISSTLSERWRVFAGGHPLPNQASLDAAREAINLLRRADHERALVLFLISGGASASFEWPLEARVTLEDLREANRVLVSCGATIAEVNAVRRAFSAVKGGRLSALAPQAQQIGLIVSDTNAGEEWAVASGPTFAPPTDAPAALDVISRYKLAKSLPPSILRVVEDTATEKPQVSSGIHHHLLLDNRSAMKAAQLAAEERGFVVEVADDIIEQPVEYGCGELLAQLYEGKGRNEVEVFCLISGGEFACPVRGDGTGGRNAETVLRAAIALDENASGQTGVDADGWHTVVLSAGTDGVDGNSPAAGAIADEMTVERARTRGLDARRSLEQSDAYTFFHALGDAISTGPTGTNVRDLRIMLAS